MTTSVTDLLDALLADTETVTRGDGLVRADAAAALGQLGRAITELQRAGLSPNPGDLRERQAKAAAFGWRELAGLAPVAEGRLALQAAVAADAIAVSTATTTVAQRWAQTCAVLDVVESLTDIVGDGPATGVQQRLDTITRDTVRLEQTAALNPPTATDSAVLDHPIPGLPGTERAASGPTIFDATSRLAWSTRRHSTDLTVAEVLAVTFAVEELSRDARVTVGSGHQRETPDVASSWALVRQALQPFNDGSRRPHQDATSTVSDARALHQQLTQPAAPDPSPEDLLRSVQHLPAIAEALHARSRQWGDSEDLLAHARDLPHRDGRTTARISGQTVAGLVHADAADLLPVTTALHDARLLSVELAAHAASVAGDPSTRRLRASHRAALSRGPTADAIEAARVSTYQRLHPTPTPTGPRR